MLILHYFYNKENILMALLIALIFISLQEKYYVSISTVYCFIFQLRPHVPKFKTPTEEDFENIKLISNGAYA